MKHAAMVCILLVAVTIVGCMLVNLSTRPVPSSPATPSEISAPAPAPAASPTPTPASAVTATPAKPSIPAAGLTVTRMVIAGALRDRQPVNIGTIFPVSQDRVFCYLELAGVTRDQKIAYVWTHGGKTERHTNQAKKSERWRTWSYKALDGKRGDWKVDVLDESGNMLKSATFKVE